MRSLMPAGIDPTLYDVGRLISLWVSAFEILVHPGGNDQVNCDKVVDQIEKTGWNFDAMKDLGCDVYDYESRTMKKRTLASWLYKRLYDCRNNFCTATPSITMTSGPLARNGQYSSTRRRFIGSHSPRFSRSLSTAPSQLSLIPMRTGETTMTTE